MVEEEVLVILIVLLFMMEDQEDQVEAHPVLDQEVLQHHQDLYSAHQHNKFIIIIIPHPLRLLNLWVWLHLLQAVVLVVDLVVLLQPVWLWGLALKLLIRLSEE